MKVSTSSLKSQTNRRQVVPVIPLTRPETKISLTKQGEYSVLKCKTTPDAEGSATYDLPIPYFKTGTAEEFLRWRRNVHRALTGQNVTTGPGQYNLTRKLLDGDALMVFNLKATEVGNETVTNYKTVMAAVTAHVFPLKALQTQKRYMRRFLRKPRDMKAREFVSRVCEINELLTEFPEADDDSKLPRDELLDLMEFGMPGSWQKVMILLDFDPVNHSIAEFVGFCERLELTEPESNRIEKKVSFNHDKPIPKKRKTTSGFKAGTNGKYCMLHGECGHSTEECRMMKRHADTLKSKYSKDIKNINRDKQVQAMFKEVMTQYTEQANAKRKKKFRKRSEKELKAFEEMELDKSSSSEEDENKEEDPFGSDSDTFSDIEP